MLEFSSDLFHYQVNLGILEVNLATLTLDKDVNGFKNQRGYDPYPVEFNVQSEKTGKILRYRVFKIMTNHKNLTYGMMYRPSNGDDLFYNNEFNDPYPHIFIYDGRD